MAEQKCRECGHGSPAAALYCERCGKSLHAGDRDPLVGQTIASRFYIVERVGQGTAGTLYRAEHVTLRRRMAVKLLHKHLAQDDDAVERFRREAITVCEIDNDHIPQVHDFGRADDGRLFFAMEFLEGEPLSAVITREGPLPFERCVDILSQVADGLMEAHTLGYVHRDLRPRSIFLSRRRGRQDFVKILDFGLAKLVQPEVDAQRTAMGMTYGDPRYMAPEQARGDAVDRRADIYSLGALGFEMLTGEPPFVGDGAFAILGKVLDAPVPRVRDRRPDCAAWLESVVRMALSKSPTERFQTVSQLLDALERKQVLQTQPPLPGPAVGKIAPGRLAAASSPALRPLPSTPIKPISTSLPPSQGSAAPAAGSTQAMPTVAPAKSDSGFDEGAGTIRQTLAYPAVNFSHTPAAPAKPAAPKAASSTDEIRLIGARTVSPAPAPLAKASASTPAAKPITVSTPAVKPVAAAAKSASSVPAVKPVSVSVPAVKPVAAKSVSVAPTTPKRSDPTPRTVSALLEQEAMGWLEAADSITDETPVQAAAPAPKPIVEQKPIAAVEKPAPVADPTPTPTPSAAFSTATSAAASAAASAKKAAALASAAAAIKPLGVTSALARKSTSNLDADSTLPTPKLAAEEVTSPLPKAAPSPAVALRPSLGDIDHDTELQPKLDTSLADTSIDGLDREALPARSDLSPESSADTPKDAAAAGWFASAAAPAEEHFADDDSYVIARPRMSRRVYIAGAAAVGVLLIGWLALRGPSKPALPTVNPPPVSVENPPPAATTPENSPPTGDTPPAANGPSAEATAPTMPLPSTAPGSEAPKPLAGGPAETAKTTEPVVAKSAPEPTKAPAKPIEEKPAAKPAPEAVKPANKPIAEAPKPAAKPVEEKPVVKPAPEAAKPANKPIAEAPKPAAKPAADAAKPAAKPANEPLKAPAGTKVAAATPPPPSKPAPSADLLKAPEFPKPTGTDENLGAKQQEAAALINLGKKKLEDGEPEAAAQSFTKATELDPKNPSAFGGLGEAAFEQGDFEEALRQLKKAIALAPRRVWYQELLAAAQFKLGRYKEAVATCKQVLKTDPNSKRAKQTLEQAEKKL